MQKKSQRRKYWYPENNLYIFIINGKVHDKMILSSCLRAVSSMRKIGPSADIISIVFTLNMLLFTTNNLPWDKATKMGNS